MYLPQLVFDLKYYPNNYFFGGIYNILLKCYLNHYQIQQNQKLKTKKYNTNNK